MSFQKFLDFSVYLLARCVICAIQMTSLEQCDRVSWTLARFLADWTAIRRKLTERNLRLVFPHWSQSQIRRARIAMWHHLLLMLCEIAHAPRKIHRTNWRKHYSITGQQQFLKIMMDKRPSILVTGHFGNFELGGYLTGLFGLKTTSIARPLDNPYVQEFITEFRSMFGQHFLPKEGSSGEVQNLLERGQVLALLADQFAGNKGCWVEFLGHPTSCHKALALFTLSSGAIMAVILCRRRDRPLHFDLQIAGVADPLIGGDHLASVEALTKWYNEHLASAIRAHPEQYWWLHDRWRDPPKKRKEAAAK